jgi:hypothetical protein
MTAKQFRRQQASINAELRAKQHHVGSSKHYGAAVTKQVAVT